MRASLLALPLLALFAPDSRADILQPGQILRVTFTIDNNWTTVPPDVLSLNFGIITVNAAYGMRMASLYDGNTLLGTDVKSSFGGHVGLLSLNPSNSFVSSTSVWSFKGPEVVDFTSILDGTIDGVMDFSIAQGEVDIPLNQVNLSMIRGTGPSSGIVVNPQPTVTSVQILDGSIGTSYCTAAANSVSPAGSRISAQGSTSLADANVTLIADNAPTQPALFYFGPNQVNLPFGNGFRCVGGTTTRMPVIAGSGGQFTHAIDFGVFGGLLAGLGTANFQCWYRDPAAGGAFFNLSDGLEIVFTP